MPNPVPIQSDVDTDGRPRIASRVIFESSHDYRAYISQAGAFPAAALFGPMRSYAVLCGPVQRRPAVDSLACG
ncbi:hypothetical protein CJU94_23895 [Paraburkholderia aromaticivorans]|uniref:Uncharacterized protein n=1 Tax=Paraburkholderia aromaticivorans TaxID=2026199 RepID=A0A248VSC8_9BURK|nr:hypothetical protein CJU94_23895 [Paraburkholderia aromaticivorans]